MSMEQQELWKLVFATPIKESDNAHQGAVDGLFNLVVEPLKKLRGNQEQAVTEAKLVWSTLHGICILKHDLKLDVHGEADPYILSEKFLERFL